MSASIEIDKAAIAAAICEERFDELHLMKMGMDGSESFVVHAPPFGGKDTLAEIMAIIFGGEWASSGDLLRRAKLNAGAQASLDRGDIVTSDIFFDHALPLIAGPEQAGKILWLSAVGRCVGEPPKVLDFLEARGHKPVAVIYVDVDSMELRRRRDAGRDGEARPDDGPQQFEHRLGEFQQKTRPAIQEYADAIPLVRVDGAKHPHDVALDIVDGLYAVMIG